MRSFGLLSLTLATLFGHAFAHLVLTYPGSRGNNLKTSGRTPDDQVPYDGLGVNYDNKTGELVYPYGMQWTYPCGGMPTTQNRTKWPVTGGAVAFQPGWFNGHKVSYIYINMGFGTTPPNMSHPLVPVFQIVGPSNLMYPGTFCLPQLPLPPNITVHIGDNATIQVVETAQHGAALYSCVDITFADPRDVAEVNSSNCFNSSIGQNNGGPIGFNFVYAAEGQTAGAVMKSLSWTTLVLMLGTSMFNMLM